MYNTILKTTENVCIIPVSTIMIVGQVFARKTNGGWTDGHEPIVPMIQWENASLFL